MTEIEVLLYTALLAGFGVYWFRRRQRRPSHGLPYLQNALQGNADSEQLRELADALAKSVINQAKTLKKPPLFVTASGDLYDDFFPAREPSAGHTAEQFANIVLADCVRRYRETRNSRKADLVDFHTFALCAGAGLAVSSFRRLADCSPDMRDLAEFLAPAPDPDDWETYKEYYREAGTLLGVPRERLDASLLKRQETIKRGPVQ